jgi:hypothetical protein
MKLARDTMFSHPVPDSLKDHLHLVIILMKDSSSLPISLRVLYHNRDTQELELNHHAPKLQVTTSSNMISTTQIEGREARVEEELSEIRTEIF